MASYYLGLMSGTSADGIDIALVDFADDVRPRLVASHYEPYNQEIRESITRLYVSGSDEIEHMGRLDKLLANEFSLAVQQILSKQNITAKDIQAIGNHGQTIRHRPNPSRSTSSDIKNDAFTLQIGCSQTLACLTGIPVIGKFRDKDIALGGQGAPLVPAFHQQLFTQCERDNIVLNIGGIANLTFLPGSESTQARSSKSTQSVTGFDTGPGNCLLDDWYVHNHSNGNHYDQSGHWATKGNLIPTLLDVMCADLYFQQPAPKSTGREIFHLDWLASKIALAGLTLPLPEDVQATLLALTANTIANDIKSLSTNADVWLCGGGRHNTALTNALRRELTSETSANSNASYQLASIDDIDIDGDNLEAMAFAWLAYAYQKNIFSNMPSVTGARKSTTLGVLFNP